MNDVLDVKKLRMKKENEGMKKVLVLVLAVMIAATSAWAYDDAQHVKIAPNGKGDLLIFPFYFAANGGWQTKVSVINTSTTWSTVAKVVIRTNFYSQEVLDFMIYLTPADVWTATITNDGTSTWLESTDDSMYAPNGQFASAANPAKVLIANPKHCSAGSNKYNVDDSSQYGYMEVIESWYGEVSQASYNSSYQVGESRTRPVSKTFLARVYKDWSGQSDGGPNVNDPRLNALSADRTINILSGYMEFQNSLLSGYTSSMRATVFADWDNTDALNASRVSGITLASRNTFGELEATLAKNNIAMPYVHQGSDLTVHIMSFPTKASNFDTGSGDNYCRLFEGGLAGRTGGVGPYWNDPTVPAPNTYASADYACPSYGFSSFDLSEGGASGPYSGQQGTANSLCREVNLLLSSNGFRTVGTGSVYAEGWTNYNISTHNNAGGTNFNVMATPALVPANHTYFGVPVIPTVLMFKRGGMELMEGSYTDGHVYGTVIAVDPNAEVISPILLGTGIVGPGTTPTTGSLPPYYNTAVGGWATGWPNGGTYATGFAWLPEYKYSNVIPELGRDTY